MLIKIDLYELAGADRSIRFSPHCWKIRMALKHKGLEFDTFPVCFTQKEKIAFSGQPLLPVLRNGEDIVSDSWKIALYLEEYFPNQPSLFGGDGTIALTQFINSWADLELGPTLAPMLVPGIYMIVDAKDRDYFRHTREQRLGKSLETIAAGHAQYREYVDRALVPLRGILKRQPFIAGTRPAYADYCVFGFFMWVRCASKLELLTPEDPVWAWREHLLHAFDDYAASAPTIEEVACP